MLNLYDTATKSVKPLAMREPGKVSIYLCGPTVYGPPHLGHGRATLVYDILRRYLSYTGLQVRLVSNITDIDDKIIDRAQREGRPWNEITDKCENVWFEAMGKLGVQRPDDVPHATEYVQQMVDMIATLIGRDAAYVTDDGVYLSIAAVPDYGLLAHQSVDDMLSGGGDREVFGAGNKKHPADFALWKFTKPSEPAWPSPWGEGRPGWHLECSAMIREYLGDSFDLHSGGVDLVFPHHENEIAQSRCACGGHFAHTWFHIAHLMVDGGKMSKSLGNLYTLEDLATHGWTAMEVRYVLISGHYRKPLNFTFDSLHAAREALTKLAKAAAALAEKSTAATTMSEVSFGPFQAAWDALNDDLNTAGALGGIFTGMRESAKFEGAEAAQALAALNRILRALGLTLPEPEKAAEIPADVRALAEQRLAVRQAKDWAQSDVLRDQLAALGWTVKDNKDGYELLPK